MKKYIVNDIANDINNLKKKISKDVSFLGNEESEINHHQSKEKIEKSMERRKASSGKGS